MDNPDVPMIRHAASLCQQAIDAHPQGDAASIQKHSDRAVAYARQLLGTAPAATLLPYAADLNSLIKELQAASAQAAVKQKQLAAVTDAALSGSEQMVPLWNQLLQGPADPTKQLQSRLDSVLFMADLSPDEPADAPAPAAAPTTVIEPEPEPEPELPFTKEERALATLVAHPDWTVTKIAKVVGVSRTTVYGWPKFMAAVKVRESGRADLPRGSRDAGNFEAWER